MVKEEITANYISRLTQSPPLTQEEEIAYAEAFKKGCTKSREKLIQSNMRLVINVAKSYRNHAIPLEDLVQEGAIGLMHAIERFDPRKGFQHMQHTGSGKLLDVQLTIKQKRFVFLHIFCNPFEKLKKQGLSMYVKKGMSRV